MEQVGELRRRAGMTQAALSRASGIPQPNIAAYESGSRRPSRATVERIRRAAKPRPSTVLAEHVDELKQLVHKHKATHPRVFGSVARGTDESGSDLDLLVRFTAGASLFDLVELQGDLQDLLGVNVDVVSEGGLKAPRREILEEAREL